MKDDQNEPQPREARRDGKLPYERPAVISDEVFETLALSCVSGRGTCSPTSQS